MDLGVWKKYIYKVHTVHNLQVLDGQFHIKITLKNGDLYKGTLLDENITGKGKIVYGRSSGGGYYEGQWSYNKKEGQGVSVNANDDKYEG